MAGAEKLGASPDMNHREGSSSGSAVSTSPKTAPRSSPQSGAASSAPPLLILGCIVFVFLQPVFLTIIPLTRYDQARLPGYGFEPSLLTSVSWRSWRCLLVSFFGIRCGLALWRDDRGASKKAARYLMAMLISAVALLIGSMAVPFHSYLRRIILTRHAVDFLEAFAVFMVWHAYFFRRQSTESKPGALVGDGGQELGMSRHLISGTMLLAVSACAMGLVFTGLAFHNPPTDIFEAAWEGDLKWVQTFGGSEEAVNSTNEDGNTPLHLAKTREIAAFLVGRPQKAEMIKARANALNRRGEAPLHLAALDGRADVVAFLLERGAGVNAQNRMGLTPLDLALFGKSIRREGQHDQVINLLIEKGGKTQKQIRDENEPRLAK
jgi:hypothetical protein